MHIHKHRGFTLIELLVVIAIIGVLSAVVLSSLGTARNKGNDSAVKSDLHTVITQAAIFFPDNHNTYGTLDNGSGGPTTCPTPGSGDTSIFGDTNVSNAIASALTDAGGSGTTYCLAADANYVAAVSRPTDGTNPAPSTYWCVDSIGTQCGINDVPTGPDCGTCITSQ
jgi:prepilin-type N-terminal cleavage/methylation domain-containing protein